MKVRIHRESMTASKLVHEIALNGYVAFVAARTRQRELAHEALKELHTLGRQVREGEARSPNAPMCMVDIEWHDFDTIVASAAKEDDRWHRQSE